MEITTREQGPVLIASVCGSVLHEDIDGLSGQLTGLSQKGWKNIVLDMEKCDFAASMTLAVILKFKKKLNTLDGDLKTAAYNKNTGKLLALSTMKKKVDLFDTVEEAVKAF
jgi:anti-anti-sigma factor